MAQPKPATVAEEALEVAQWLGTGQALLARLQEMFGELWELEDIEHLPDQHPVRLQTELHQSVGQLIGEAVEHFGRMP